MPRMLKVVAETLLYPHGPMLVECVKGAVNDYFSLYPASVRAFHSRRTRANIIRDHIIQRAMEAFANVPGVNRVRNATKGRYTLLSVDGRALLRFKYLGSTKRSRNFKTPLAKAFANNQVAIADLPTEATRFDVGYIWNDLETGIVEVLISCPKPTGYEYVISLWSQSYTGALPFPTPEIVAPDSSAETQVVAAESVAPAAGQDADGSA